VSAPIPDVRDLRIDCDGRTAIDQIDAVPRLPSRVSLHSGHAAGPGEGARP
jgi:hypothetical protein